jgi:hypothetical protein
MYFWGESPRHRWGVGLALNPSPTANFAGVMRGTIAFFFDHGISSGLFYWGKYNRDCHDLQSVAKEKNQTLLGTLVHSFPRAKARGNFDSFFA